MGSTYTVRSASETDLLAVLDVLAQNAPNPPRRPPQADDASTDQRKTWERMLATYDLAVYVAERDGDAVGTTCLLVVPNLMYDCRPTAFIEPVVVKYAHRRRGVARLMMERVLDDARKASCYKVQLLSHKRHAEDGAHSLYRSVGFVPEAEGFRLYLSS